MEIRESARKHGITESEIQHALDHAMRLVEFDYDGEERLLVIGDGGRGSC